MKYQDELYFLFYHGEFRFLIPLSWIEKIEADGRKYILVLQKEEIRFEIAADGVEGIRRIKEEEIIPLGKPVINEKNDYLTGAARIMEDGKEFAAFLLSPEILYGKSAGLDEKDCI